MARVRPPQVYSCHLRYLFRPRIRLRLIRGHLLLSEFRNQQENLYQHEKRDQKQTRHGGTLLFRLCHTGHVVKGGSRTQRDYSRFQDAEQGKEGVLRGDARFDPRGRNSYSSGKGDTL